MPLYHHAATGSAMGSRFWRGGVGVGVWLWIAASDAAAVEPVHLTQTVKQVSVSERGAAWRTVTVRAPKILPLQSGDRVKTGEFSSATIEQAGRKLIRLDELTLVEFRAPSAAGRVGSQVNLSQGLLYFLSREQADNVEMHTPSCVGALRGTEFTVQVLGDGTSRFLMLGGKMALRNPQGDLDIQTGQAAEVVPGKAPRLIPVIEARRAIQWNLYYSALVDLDRLPLDNAERRTFARSIAAYRQGDVLAAYEAFPWENRMRMSAAARVYAAGLLMTTGQVDKAAALSLGDGAEARALCGLIGTVRNTPQALAPPSSSASEWLAQSYACQGAGRLPDARDAAAQAAALAPGFGFAWARLGELELASGNYRAADGALSKAVALTPRNAYAWAVHGFVRVALRQPVAANTAFQQAVSLDGRQSNGWLGLGLLAFQQGRMEEGRRCLLQAAALEPRRSLLRSYLAQGLAETRDVKLAMEEIGHAKQLDPLDPTPWLHAATLYQRMLDDRSSVADLESSLRLNRNRKIHRTDPQLAADDAARRTNLAAAYERTGMAPLAPKQAAWASLRDFGNAESHLFLANGYDALRDPNGFELEMEAAWQNELLLANMLALPGSAVVGKTIGLQEYGAMFRRSGPSGNLRTYATDNGDFEQTFEHRQTTATSSLALDLSYRDANGFRANNDGLLREAELRFRTAVGLADAVYLQAGWSRVRGGDMFRLPWLGLARPDLAFDEEMLPSLWMGYTHRWEGGNAVTMLLAGHHEASQMFSDRGVDTINLLRNAAGTVTGAAPLDMDVRHWTEVGLSSVEIAHYQQFDSLRLLAGARYQWGDIETRNLLENPPPLTAPYFSKPPASSRFQEVISNRAVYGYTWWDVSESLTLQAGATYEALEYPANFRHSPVSPGSMDTDQLSLKAGFLWQPLSQVSVWGAYAEALGGVTFEEGMTLEPSQTAGMVHDYRSIISESLVGSVSAPEMQIASGGLMWHLGDHAYFDLDWRGRDGDVERQRGVFTLKGMPPLYVDSTRERLQYSDQRAQLGIHYLLDHGLSLSAAWSWTHAELDQLLPDLPASGAVPPAAHYAATLNQPQIGLAWQHSSGIFAETRGTWFMQENEGFPNEHAFVLDASTGFRDPSSRRELRVGVMNLADQSYTLNPLTSRDEPVSQRMFFIEFKQSY